MSGRPTPGQAPWWLPGGHLQTFWRKLAPVSPPVRSRQRVELSDGDFIDLDWAAADPDAQQPLVLLVHGLAGCSSSPYILAMQSMLQQSGCQSVAMNLRGCSGEYNRLASAYHSGCSDDVEQVVTALLAGQPADRRLSVVGYSLGANVLIKWLSETRHYHRVSRAVSVSNPFSLALCSGRMNRGVAFWYGHYFLQRLRTELNGKTQHLMLNGRDDQLALIRALGPLEGLRTLWDFDEAVIAPLHGFASAQDYYAQCSSAQFLARVPVPTLVIHGSNDPIIPVQALPAGGELPAHIQCELLPTGGHVGFPVRGQPHWLERRIVDFIQRDSEG